MVSNNDELLSVNPVDNTNTQGPPAYEEITDNIYLFERKRSKSKKEVRRMLCDCTISKEDLQRGLLGCLEDCLNRLLMIECGSRCATAESCSNKKFQKKEWLKAEPFKTEKKGWGLRALENAKAGTFIMEYVGEVLDRQAFKQRVKQYAKAKCDHYYFMSLKSNEIIDATFKGNHSRFINHSCSPNCETQKWTVNGELRIGFFTKLDVVSGEELTFDYKFQRYGREAQKCYCESENCTGYIGEANTENCVKSEKLGKRKKSVDKEDKKRPLFEDLIFDEELDRLCSNGGLTGRAEALVLARLMVRAEDMSSRLRLLDVILKTNDIASLRLFLDYHGLSLIWSWMADVDDFKLKSKILEVLSLLPVPNKTVLLDSKVINVVQKWAENGHKQNNTVCTEIETEVDENVETSLSTEESPPNYDSEKLEELGEENGTDSGGSLIKDKLSTMASQLLQSWSTLKEIFRIPRLEQQKRAELEAEQQAKNNSIVNENVTNKYLKEEEIKYMKIPVCVTDDSSRSKKHMPRMSKEERRLLFAMEVEQRDEATRKLNEESKNSESFYQSPCLYENLGVLANTSPAAMPFSTDMHLTEQKVARKVLLPTPNLAPQIPFPPPGGLPPHLPFIPPNLSQPPPPLPILHPPPNILCQPAPTPDIPQILPPQPASAIAQNILGSSVMLHPSSITPGADATTSALLAKNDYLNTPFCFPLNAFNFADLEKPPVKLPPNWKTATDSEGSTYYYHSVTRQTQWDPPDIDTPLVITEDELQHKTTTAPADTSCAIEVVKKIKELFRTKMSSYVVQILNSYRKPDCHIGRIRSTEEFKYLARKLTHVLMAKELRHCKNIEHLQYNDSVKNKAKDFIVKYMLKFGPVYRKEKML